MIGWVRHRLAGWPLTSRLVALLLSMVVAGLLVAGVAATAALRGYLYDEVDAGLVEAASRVVDRGPLPPLGAEPPAGEDFQPIRPGPVGEQLTYIEVVDAAGAAYPPPESNSAVADPPVLTQLTAAEAAALAGEPYLVGSASGDRRWRVVTLPLAGATGSVTAAVDISAVDATVHRLVVLELAIGSAVLLAVGLLGWALVRRSLRPLAGVEHAAAAIAAGDLSRRAPTADPRTEVGSLAASFNTMVDELQDAFAAQAASEQQALRAAAEAQASEQRMRQFIADASHELRTPLTSVRGFAELYRMGAVASGEPLDDTMARIEAESGRMGLLVEDLLLLARLDQQRPFEEASVDLLALATDAVVACRAAAPDRPIRLEADPAVPAPVVVGDEVRLRQVVDNLLSNALRYSPQQAPIVVRVGVETSGEAPAAVLEVADSGPGLAPDDAARIFERFFRADPARSRAHGGSGLGLSIVAAIVERHGGTVEVRSTPGAGATFRVLLPVQPQPTGRGRGVEVGAGQPIRSGAEARPATSCRGQASAASAG